MTDQKPAARPEYRIREVTRFVITRYDEKGSHALTECDNREAAVEVVGALRAQHEATVPGVLVAKIAKHNHWWSVYERPQGGHAVHLDAYPEPAYIADSLDDALNYIRK